MTEATSADARLAQAERTNARRDEGERAAGFAIPSDGPPEETVRTAVMALYAGLTTDDWDAVAEAAAMLGDLADFRPWRRGGA